VPAIAGGRLPGVLLAVAVGLYVLAPGHPLGLLRGVPLDWLGVLALALLGCALYAFGAPGWGWGLRAKLALGLTGLLLGAKALLWLVAPEYGLAASYYPRARISGPPERSTEYPSASYTRREVSPGQPSFQLHFFNDVERFNYYEPPDPDRATLPFAVRYEGYLHVPTSGTLPVELSARGVAILAINGSPVLTTGSRDVVATDRATLTLAPGPHPVQLDYLHQGGTSPSLWLSVQPLTAAPLTSDQLARDRLLGWLAVASDLLVLAGLGSWTVLAAVRRVRMMRAPSLAHGPDEQPRWGEGATRLSLLERPLLATLLLAVTVYALITTADLAGRATVLEGGQDWLTYESYARDIQLNGLLMTLGEPLGKGKPFFFQPFYPYSLALMHWLTGEGVWGPTVLQLMGLGVAAALVYELGKRLFGAAAGLVALLLFLGLGLSQLDWIARKLLSENLYFVVLPAALLFLARAIDERRLPDLAWAGLLFGVASVTRAPTLLFMPGAALVLVLAWRRAGRSLNRIAAGFAVLALCTTAVAALVPIRNYIVSGKPALVASNGGATLLLAHQPTDRVSLRGVDRNPLYNRLNLDRATREVVEFARQDPVGYFWTLVPLGLYSVGVSGAVEGHPPVAPDILLITGLYAVAVLVLPAARTLRTWPLHIFIVLHFGIMITFLPYVYGYRQVLPMQQLMLVFDGLLLVMVIRRLLLRRGAESPGQPLLEQRPA
jgi:hypothetical protein